MMFPVVVAGKKVGRLLKPFWKLEGRIWTEITHEAVMQWEIESFYMNKEASFPEWLKLCGFMEVATLPEEPFCEMLCFTYNHRRIKVFRYANPQGFWSHKNIGENYSDFFLLKNGTYTYKTLVKEVDIGADLKITAQRLTERWHKVREESESYQYKSSAVRLSKKDYVTERLANLIVPDYMVIPDKNGQPQSHRLVNLVPQLRINTYCRLLGKLAPSTPLLAVECHT